MILFLGECWTKLQSAGFLYVLTHQVTNLQQFCLFFCFLSNKANKINGTSLKLHKNDTDYVWATCNCWSWLELRVSFFCNGMLETMLRLFKTETKNEIHFRCIFRNVFKSNIDNCGWIDIDCLWLHIYLYSRTERLPTVAVATVVVAAAAARLVCCCVCCVCVVWFSFCTLLSCVGIFTLFVNISLVGFFASELVLSLSAGGLNKMFWLFLSHEALWGHFCYTCRPENVAQWRFKEFRALKVSSQLQHWITIETSL